MNSINADLIRGHNDTIILRTLIDNDRYGYEIIDIIENSSSGSFKIKQPTLYNALKRLEKSGFITSYFGDESGGGRRRYYKLTSKGQELLLQDQKEWETTRTIIDKLLSDKQVDLSDIEPLPELINLRPFTKRTHINNVNYDLTDESETIETVDDNDNYLSSFCSDADVSLSSSSDLNYNLDVVITTEANAVPHKAEDCKKIINPLFDPNLSEKVLSASAPQEFSNVNLTNNADINTLNKEYFNIDYKAKSMPTSVFSEEKMKAYNLLYGVIPPKQENHATTDSPSKETFFQKKTIAIHQNIEPKKTRSLNSLYAIYGRTDTDTSTAYQGSPEYYLSKEQRNPGKLFNDTKNTLEQEGYKVKEYKKNMSNEYYYNNYIYKAKLVRDTAFITFLSFIITLLLIVSLNTIFLISFDVYIILGLCSLLLPLTGLLYYIANPLRRAKVKYSTSASIINGFVIIICVFAITAIFFLLTPSLDINFNTPAMYISLILCLNIPLSSLYRFFLLRTKNYNVN